MKDNPFEHYRSKRRLAYERLDAIRAAIDALLAAHGEEDWSMTDIANLEGLHLQRREILDEFDAAEQAFLDYLLGAHNGSPR